MPEFDPDPCKHVAGPARFSEPPEVGLARAHTIARMFGVDVAPRNVDNALADALDGADSMSPARLSAYASAIGACLVPSAAAPLGPASVKRRGATVIVRPGTTEPVVPAGARRVVLDLRDLPDDPRLTKAIRDAVVATLSGKGTLPGGIVRTCNGFPDEVYRLFVNVDTGYSCSPASLEGAEWSGRGRAPHVVIWTSPRLAPAAARWAAALRLEKRARIVGEHVLGGVAEMRGHALGPVALASRVELAKTSSGALPDVIEADVRTGAPEGVTCDDGAPSDPIMIPSTRKDLDPWQSPADSPPVKDRVGDARAAVIVAYGTLERFFPYFEEVGKFPDTLLAELLGSVRSDQGRWGAIKPVLDLTIKLQDGHSSLSVLDALSAAAVGFPSTFVVPIGDELVVATTGDPNVRRGDVLLSIDGEPTATSFAFFQTRISGSPQRRRSSAARSLLFGATVAEFASQDGSNRRTVTLDYSMPPNFSPWDRAPGALTDVGAGDIYYVSLNGGSLGTTSLDAVRAGMQAATGGVILDMRGYPGEDSWKLLSMIAPLESQGPDLSLLVVTADETRFDTPFRQHLSDFTEGTGYRYTGKVAMLVGPDTQSAAEHLTEFYRDSRRGPLVGLPTSGANGNITGAQLTGAFGILFTGLRVRRPDGSPFHAIGHVPDVVQGPTRESLLNGTDADLLRAIAELRSGG